MFLRITCNLCIRLTYKISHECIKDRSLMVETFLFSVLQFHFILFSTVIALQRYSEIVIARLRGILTRGIAENAAKL